MIPKKRIRQLRSKTIYQGKIFRLDSVLMRAPDGHEFEHQVIRHPGAVVIIPRISRDRFLLVRQFRTSVRKVLWEFPAGTLEAGETPLACAKREMVEETGYRAKRWKKLAQFYPAPGISTELIHLYLARELTEAQMSPDKDEYLECRELSFNRLRHMIDNGNITDAKTMLGFFFCCGTKPCPDGHGGS